MKPKTKKKNFFAHLKRKLNKWQRWWWLIFSWKCHFYPCCRRFLKFRKIEQLIPLISDVKNFWEKKNSNKVLIAGNTFKSIFRFSRGQLCGVSSRYAFENYCNWFCFISSFWYSYFKQFMFVWFFLFFFYRYIWYKFRDMY